MQYPPISWEPSEWSVLNGQPAYAKQARAVDAEAIYLATRKPSGVDVPGPFVDTGSAYYLPVRVPQFTHHIRLGFLCAGRGRIDAGCSADSYSTRIEIYTGTGAAGSHSIDDAVLLWQDEPMGSVSVHTHNRALDVAFQDSNQDVVLDVTVTDASGSESLTVYAFYVRFLAPDGVTELP